MRIAPRSFLKLQQTHAPAVLKRIASLRQDYRFAPGPGDQELKKAKSKTATPAEQNVSEQVRELRSRTLVLGIEAIFKAEAKEFKKFRTFNYIGTGFTFAFSLLATAAVVLDRGAFVVGISLSGLFASIAFSLGAFFEAKTIFRYCGQLTKYKQLLEIWCKLDSWKWILENTVTQYVDDTIGPEQVRIHSVRLIGPDGLFFRYRDTDFFIPMEIFQGLTNDLSALVAEGERCLTSGRKILQPLLKNGSDPKPPVYTEFNQWVYAPFFKKMFEFLPPDVLPPGEQPSPQNKDQFYRLLERSASVCRHKNGSVVKYYTLPALVFHTLVNGFPNLVRLVTARHRLYESFRNLTSEFESYHMMFGDFAKANVEGFRGFMDGFSKRLENLGVNRDMNDWAKGFINEESWKSAGSYQGLIRDMQNLEGEIKGLRNHLRDRNNRGWPIFRDLRAVQKLVEEGFDGFEELDLFASEP